MYPHASRSGSQFLVWAPLVLAMLYITPAIAEIRTGTDEEARLPYWEISEPGLSIRLVQRLPDQTRGFFQARGFSVEDSELIAQACVFQTVFRNTSTAPTPVTIEYKLREWVVRAAGRRGGLRTREDWSKQWAARKSPPPARLAFEWALLPTHQTYQAGDYNWGMTLYGLKPGAGFDLDVVWYRDGVKQTATINGMRCAPDILLRPDEL